MTSPTTPRTALPPAAVTGFGALTPLGAGVSELWSGLLEVRSGARVLEEEWADKVPVRIAAQVTVDPVEVLGRVTARTLDRVQQLALIAAREAWADAGKPEVEPERLAVVVGTGIGGALTMLGQHDVVRDRGSRRVSPHTVPMLMPNGPAAAIGLEVGARGGVHTPVSACASGAEAISLGLDLLRLDRADVVVVGGSEACIHPLPMAGFGQMRALSTSEDPHAASRPFDKARDGFLLGEGAGILVLERAESAAARGATVHGYLGGGGVTSDGHHITAPDPAGSGAARAILRALRDAGLEPSDVVHVNAHATSTPVGDVAEAAAMRKALGDALDDIAVTSNKGNMGHLLGAAGAVEAIVSLLTLRERLVPPTRNLEDQDDDVRLDVVTVAPRQLTRAGAAVSNSFGFGGHNAALAFLPA